MLLSRGIFADPPGRSASHWLVITKNSLGRSHHSATAAVAMPPRLARLVHIAPCRSFAIARRTASTQTSAPDALPPRPDPTTPNARSLDELRTRIGKCIMFGLKSHQMETAGAVSQEIARDWRRLLAGREGFLTAPDRRGLYRQAVVWGEMVSSEPEHPDDNRGADGELDARTPWYDVLRNAVVAARAKIWPKGID